MTDNRDGGRLPAGAVLTLDERWPRAKDWPCAVVVVDDQGRYEWEAVHQPACTEQPSP